MKKHLLFLIVFVCFQTFNYAQEFSFGLGFRSHINDMKEFRDVMIHYNDTRPWLDNGMATRATMNGFEFGLEFSYEKMGLSLFKFYRLGTTRIAKGTDLMGEEFKRKVKLRMIGVDVVDIWLTPLHYKGLNFGGGIMPAGFAGFIAKTKYNDDEQITIDLKSKHHIYSQLHIDITNGSKEKNTAWHLQIFFNFAHYGVYYDLYELNREINPTTFDSMNKRTLIRPDCFGFKLNYSFK